MVQANVVEEQLRRIGANFRFWNKPELNELPKILFEGEEINHVVSGRYEGGFAILVSTDQRVILIDKKPFFLTLEDIRYDRIADVELNHRLLDATLRLGALSKDLKFTGYNPSKMRDLTTYIQQRVMQSRDMQQTTGQQGQMQPAQQFSNQPTPTTGYAQPQSAQVSGFTQAQPAQQASEPELAPQPQANFGQTSTIAALNQVTEAQSGVIGQVAVMSMDDPATVAQPAINPYKTPLMFRRRVSRFY